MKPARRAVTALLSMGLCLGPVSFASAQPGAPMSADVCANLLTEAQSAIGPMGGYGHDALAAQRRGDKRQAEHYRGMSNHAYDMVTDSLKAYRSCLDEEMKAAKREPSAASRG